MNKYFVIASITGAIGVILGALGAHALKNKISAEQLQSFETGVKYQLYHAIVLLILAMLIDKYAYKYLTWAANSITIGIVLFSVSIYFLSTKTLLGVENLKFLGPITPIGGLFLITGWLFIALAFVKK
ncbi:MAG: DUF423 domain-containing protein [Bacteroidota bacterium]